LFGGGKNALKKIVKLRKDQAAIIFAPQGCQLVYPEGTDTNLQHVTLAASLTVAIQYEFFIQGMYAFLKDVTTERKQEVTH